jgi:hypothetical protein
LKAHRQKNKEKDHLAQLKKQHRKQFFANLKVVCNLLAGYDLYSKFPVAFLEKIYEQRFHQVGVSADDTSISRKELKDFGEYLKAFLQVTYLDLPQVKSKVALGLLVIEGHSLIFLAKDLTDDEFPAARETRETLSSYLGLDYDLSFSKKIEDMLFAFGLMVSNFDHGYLWAHFSSEVTKTKTSVHHTFDLHKIAPIKESFKIEGHARPAYRVGWAFSRTGIVWAEIKPSQEGLTKDAPLPVFIQAHALMRLEERMELPPGLVQFAVFDSFNNLNYQMDEKGHVLIDFIYRQLKTGYLAASVESNRLLIHTFLFITNNGTPEGKKLSKLTGLQAMDKKFLAIDKLSTFLSYKINDNVFVKNIFVKAGCGHLLEIKDLEHFLFNPGKEISAETIANYLKAHKAKH